MAILVALFSFLARHAFIDDALIYARYIRNALDGHGLVFNPGEHVNALSSPFYSYLVLGVSKLLSGNVLSATIVVSGVSFFFACAMAEWLAPFAGLLMASTAYFYLLLGMETSLFLAMLLLVILLTLRERYDWLPSAVVLLMLTRFEGGALLLVLLVELYRRRRWPRPVAYLPAALIVGAYFLLNEHWYGRWFPSSASAKFDQGRSQIWGHWPLSFVKSLYQLKPDFLPTIYVVVLVAVLCGFGIRRFGRSTFNRLVLPFLAIVGLFYILFNIPGYKWYYAPFIALFMLYAAAALPRTGAWRWLAVPVIALSAINAARRISATQMVDMSSYYPAVGTWLESHVTPGTRVEMAETGTIGWYCPDCAIDDIIGLTEPKNSKHLAHRDLSSWLAEDRPSFVVVHYDPWPYEAVAKQSQDYEPLPVNFGNKIYVLRRKDGH